jgi:hypothetical protein
MAFFTAKNAGIAFMIAAILNIIGAIVVVILARDTNLAGAAVMAIGGIICALLYFLYGNKVRKGEISDKVEILAQFVKIVGIVQIVSAIFNAAGNAVSGVEIGIGSLIISIIIGLIIIFISTRINDGKQTTGDKLIWIILLIAFVICLLIAILEIISIVLIIYGICDLIVYSFMILLLTDSEVKSAMNI